MRALGFNVKQAVLKNAYGHVKATFENTNSLPINTCRDYYDSNLGILYIHDGEGELPLELALSPLLHLKQALLHTSFINELDKALVGEMYNARLFKKAVDEFISIQEYCFDTKILTHNEFETIVRKLISKIR